MNEARQAAFELRLDDLAGLVAKGSGLGGLLAAACSAHEPDAPLQRRVIRYLVQEGADVHECDKNGVTPLHRAVRFRNVTAVEELLHLGADPNVKDKRNGSTPLHRAVTSTGAPGTAGKLDAALEIARLLLAAGADPERRNKGGRTPLDYVKRAQMRAVLEQAKDARA